MTEKEWENVKKEIRSVLISSQSGSTLENFRRDYRTVIGRVLPYGKFGYISEIEFLQDMPDVVRIASSRNGYTLHAVADESTAHIQKMVARQKPSRTKSIAPRTTISRRTSSYPVAPRFFSASKPMYKPASLPADLKAEINHLVHDFRNNGISLSNVLPAYEKKYRKRLDFHRLGFSTLEACIQANPELTLVTYNNEIRIFFKSDKEIAKADTRYTSSSLKENVYSQPSHTPSSSHTVPINKPTKPLPQSLQAQPYQLPSSGFHSNTPIPEPKPVNKPNEFHQFQSFQAESIKKLEEKIPVPKKTMDSLEEIHSEIDNSGISEAMKNDFRKILMEYPNGIRDVDFPDLYKKITGNQFDLHELGYFSLSGLTDALPNIFYRKSKDRSKRDYILYPANSKFAVADAAEEEELLNIEHIFANIRNLLQAYPEGVKQDQFLHLYGINFEQSLDLPELGFDNLDNFLNIIATQIPLAIKIDRTTNSRVIHLMELDERRVYSPNGMLSSSPGYDIPDDIQPPDSHYTLQELPTDLSNCIPIFIAAIVNPHNLYIHLRGENSQEKALNRLGDNLEIFYRGPENIRYTMKDSHIMVGAVCAAIWPTDNFWYRVQIISIPSRDFVEVFYVDYGNKAKIPCKDLRYLRKEYFSIPAQAIKTRLKDVKPPNGASTWDGQAKKRILDLCRDKPLHAVVEKIADYLVVRIYDTNEDEDIFINQVLLNEGLVEYQPELSNDTLYPSYAASSGVPDPILNAFAMRTVQAYAASIQQSGAILGAYTTALRQHPQFSNLSEPELIRIASLVIPGFNPMLANNTNMMYNIPSSSTSFTPAFNPFQPFNSSIPPVSANPYVQPIKQVPESYNKGASDLPTASSSYATKADSDSEEFVDEDDEFFEALCKEPEPLVLKKLVKRIKLSDGYRIHIVVANNKPYVSYGDVSALFWDDESKPEILAKRLEFKEIAIPKITISERNDGDLFTQLERYKVKGIIKVSQTESSISLYPLRNVTDILNIFGHPSKKIREEIDFYTDNFNLCDPSWKEVDDNIEAEPEKENSKTDNNKLNRLCSYDLKLMHASLKYKKQMVLHSLKAGKDVSDAVEQVKKIDDMQSAILSRVKEIEDLCSK